MPSEIRVNPAARSCRSDAAVTDSGLASVLTSASGARPQVRSIPSRIRPSSAGGGGVGSPPPKNTVSTWGGPSPSTRRASASSPSTTSPYPSATTPSLTVYVLKSQYPQREAQNGTCTYTPKPRAPTAARDDGGSDPSRGTGSPSGRGPGIPSSVPAWVLPTTSRSTRVPDAVSRRSPSTGRPPATRCPEP